MGSYYGQEDSAELRVVFKDGDGNVLDTVSTGEVKTYGSMEYHEIDGYIAEGAATATVEMLMHRAAGNDADGYFDNMQFQVYESSIKIAGTVEPDSVIDSLTIGDEAGQTLEIDPMRISVDAEGHFEVDGIDVTALESGKLPVTMQNHDLAGNSNIVTEEILANRIVGSEADDTLLYEAGKTIDGGEGHDVLVLNQNESIDFSNLPTGTDVKHIETLDLTQNGDHHIENLSLDDVIEMTDGDNVLVIDGDEVDKVGVPEAPKDYTVEKTVENGYDVYTYSSTDGDPTVTLKIDQEVQHG
jgi:hypothetical protein